MTKNLLESCKKYVNRMLLPLEDHYYHQYEHALEVMERCIYLGNKEGISEDDIEVLAIAGLFHDVGFIIQYDDNEIIGAKIAKNFLKTLLYPEDKIELVETLILATSPDYKNPKNILEQIIKDADLDNLGTDEFLNKGEKLRQEIEIIKNIKIREPDWHHSSLDLLYEHQYFTNTQEQERGNKKIENKKKLEDLLKQEKSADKIDMSEYL